MRKDAKKIHNIEVSHQQGYHQRTARTLDGESYAYMGFQDNLYWASDRYIKLTPEWKRTDGESLKGYGLEIEMECSTIRDNDVLVQMLDKIAFQHLPNKLFKHQRDGSLGGMSSDEAITGVMTKEFIRNHYAGFKAMFEYFSKMGVSCYASGNCGMHVNISTALFGKTPEAQAEGVKKLLYFVNHHYRLCVTLFARNREHVAYCAPMDGSDYTDRTDYRQMCNCKNADLSNMSRSHGNCCNYSHYNAGRIELRLVGGQKDFPCFRNTMESVFWLVGQMNRLSWDDLDDLVKVFKGCNNYVYDRLTRCRNEGVLEAEIVNAIQPTVKRVEFI